MFDRIKKIKFLEKELTKKNNIINAMNKSLKIQEKVINELNKELEMLKNEIKKKHIR